MGSRAQFGHKEIKRLDIGEQAMVIRRAEAGDGDTIVPGKDIERRVHKRGIGNVTA